MIKTLSRHQTLVSLSSMEADLFALQSVAQELSSMGKIVARVLGSFKEIDAEQTIPGVLYSDSESALKLLRNLDLPRKSRHLEIRISWIKERVERKRLVLDFKKGVSNPSDLLTKCLGSLLSVCVVRESDSRSWTFHLQVLWILREGMCLLKCVANRIQLSLGHVRNMVWCMLGPPMIYGETPGVSRVGENAKRVGTTQSVCSCVFSLFIRVTIEESH